MAPSAISLNFPQTVRVAGETLHGTVDIDVMAAQEDDIEHVKIKFRGAIQTCVSSRWAFRDVALTLSATGQ
jgi:Fe-S cluster biogenesis protein NfuA